METGKEIWFVDDDHVFQFIIERYLTGTPYENGYEMFDDGDRALLEIVERAKSGQELPGIIFLDLNMRYMEGWETLDFLNEATKTINVVIITSSLSEMDQKRADREPMVVDYLTKPIEKHKLLNCIERTFNSDLGKMAS